MTIQTATENRKVLTDHLSRQIGEPYHYLGVPSCGYQVGPYTINRDGSITGDDFTAIRSFLVENQYIDEAALPDTEAEQTEDVPVTDDDTGTETTADAADISDRILPKSVGQLIRVGVENAGAAVVGALESPAVVAAPERVCVPVRQGLCPHRFPGVLIVIPCCPHDAFSFRTAALLDSGAGGSAEGSQNQEPSAEPPAGGCRLLS